MRRGSGCERARCARSSGDRLKVWDGSRSALVSNCRHDGQGNCGLSMGRFAQLNKCALASHRRHHCALGACWVAGSAWLVLSVAESIMEDKFNAMPFVRIEVFFVGSVDGMATQVCRGKSCPGAWIWGQNVERTAAHDSDKMFRESTGQNVVSTALGQNIGRALRHSINPRHV